MPGFKGPLTMPARCPWPPLLLMFAVMTDGIIVPADSAAAESEVRAGLRRHCGECHLDGATEGGLALDGLVARTDVAADPSDSDHARWLAVWRNLRGGTMPPADQPRMEEADRRRLVASIERDVFEIDPARPDPGHVVLRRLNRVEYANTVQDLTGIDMDVIDDLPADDTGYGFDTIASVLTVSPLLLEKYVAVAMRFGDRVAAARAVATDDESKAYPPEFRIVFAFGPPPESVAALDRHRRRTLERLATRGFRRPVDGKTLDRLDALAMAAEARGGGFEHGVAAAVVAVLSSPRFLFRVEADAPGDARGGSVEIDEYSLASRLSYLLWSSMPDDALSALAAEGRLRERLPDVVDRMIQDSRSDAFVTHFTGQWLQTRDVEALPFSLKRIVEVADEKDEGRIQRHFDEKLRPAMRAETERLFAHVLRQGLPATDILLGRSTFLNADLAAHYGIPGVEGEAMRLVDLPPGSHRGGLLTHASFLAVTSTPSRTSPVKRGLFILDNLLGMPPPPAPPNIPSLEASAKKAGSGASVRELMEIHRRDAGCAACHARMDPLGLALEEYDAIGRWRGTKTASASHTGGRLLTGETFDDVTELAARIAVDRRRDFHRCLVEKLLTYALGRGVEVHDAPAVDRIVEHLEIDGRLDAAVQGVVMSVPFQMRRREVAAAASAKMAEAIPRTPEQARR